MSVKGTEAAGVEVDGIVTSDTLPETSVAKVTAPKVAKKAPAKKEAPKSKPAKKVTAPKKAKTVKAPKVAKTAKPKTEKGAKKITMRSRTISAFNAGRALSVKNGKNGFLSLKEIYKRAHAETVGETAALRGILNRDCLDAKSTFERNPKDRGTYRLRGNAEKQITKAA